MANVLQWNPTTNSFSVSGATSVTPVVGEGIDNNFSVAQTFGSGILQTGSAGLGNQSPLLNVADAFSDFIASGMQWAIPSSASLTTSMTSGTAYLNSVRTLVPAVSGYTFPASSDTYVSFNNAGQVDYQSVANGATAPTPNSGFVQTAKVVTSPIQSPTPTLTASTSGSLASGTYQVALVAYDATGYGSVGASGSVTVAASGSIDISWVNPFNETSMDIYATTAGGTTLGLVASGVTGTSYTYTGSVAPGDAAPTTATSNAIQHARTILAVPPTHGFTNVLDFGAIGNNIADDSDAFIAADLAAQNRGNALYIPASDRYGNPLRYLIKKPVTFGSSHIYGDSTSLNGGAGSSIQAGLEGYPDGTAVLGFAAYGFFCENLTVYGNENWNLQYLVSDGMLNPTELPNYSAFASGYASFASVNNSQGLFFNCSASHNKFGLLLNSAAGHIFWDSCSWDGLFGVFCANSSQDFFSDKTQMTGVWASVGYAGISLRMLRSGVGFSPYGFYQVQNSPFPSDDTPNNVSLNLVQCSIEGIGEAVICDLQIANEIISISIGEATFNMGDAPPGVTDGGFYPYILPTDIMPLGTAQQFLFRFGAPRILSCDFQPIMNDRAVFQLILTSQPGANPYVSPYQRVAVVSENYNASPLVEGGFASACGNSIVSYNQLPLSTPFNNPGTQILNFAGDGKGGSGFPIRHPRVSNALNYDDIMTNRDILSDGNLLQNPEILSNWSPNSTLTLSSASSLEASGGALYGIVRPPNMVAELGSNPNMLVMPVGNTYTIPPIDSSIDIYDELILSFWIYTTEQFTSRLELENFFYAYYSSYYASDNSSINYNNSQSLSLNGTVTAGEVIDIIFTSPNITGSPITISYTVLSTDTLATIATALSNDINANTDLASANITAVASGNSVITAWQTGIPVYVSSSTSSGTSVTVDFNSYQWTKFTFRGFIPYFNPEAGNTLYSAQFFTNGNNPAILYIAGIMLSKNIAKPYNALGNPVVNGPLTLNESSVTNGPTGGSVTLSMPLQGTGGKQVTLTFDAYENDTTTAQTINFPTAFGVTPLILGNNTGLTLTASTTGVTITAPDSTTTYSGTAVIMGN